MGHPSGSDCVLVAGNKLGHDIERLVCGETSGERWEKTERHRGENKDEKGGRHQGDEARARGAEISRAASLGDFSALRAALLGLLELLAQNAGGVVAVGLEALEQAPRLLLRQRQTRQGWARRAGRSAHANACACACAHARARSCARARICEGIPVRVRVRVRMRVAVRMRMHVRLCKALCMRVRVRTRSLVCVNAPMCKLMHVHVRMPMRASKRVRVCALVRVRESVCVCVCVCLQRVRWTPAHLAAPGGGMTPLEYRLSRCGAPKTVPNATSAMSTFAMFPGCLVVVAWHAGGMSDCANCAPGEDGREAGKSSPRSTPSRRRTRTSGQDPAYKNANKDTELVPQSIKRAQQA